MVLGQLFPFWESKPVKDPRGVCFREMQPRGPPRRSPGPGWAVVFVFSNIVRASLPSSSFVKTDRPSRGAPANHCCRGAGTPRAMVCACGIHYFTLHPSFPAVFPYRLAARTFRGMHDPSPSHPRFEAHCEGARIGMGSGTTDALGVGAAWCVGWWVWTPRGGLLGV